VNPKHQVREQHECATSWSKALYILLMGKQIIHEEVSPLCPMTLTTCHIDGDEFINGLTIGNCLPSKPPLGLESNELAQSMSIISLKPHGLDLSCDEHFKIFNKLMEGFKGKSFHEGCLI